MRVKKERKRDRENDNINEFSLTIMLLVGWLLKETSFSFYKLG